MTKEKDTTPQHIAIIMDGNGRWAKKRGLPRSAGHLEGIKAIKRTIKACVEQGVKFLSIYAFSTENWSRPRTEVNMLMKALVKYLKIELKELYSQGVKLVVSGDVAKLPQRVQETLDMAIKETSDNKRFTVNLCLNYGGRDEIINACKEISEDIEKKNIALSDLDEKMFSRYLYTKDLPDPELLIRTSGEMRISNFLLWQLSYAEFYFTKTLWPDFNKNHLAGAIEEFRKRFRRFGGLGE